MLDTVIIIPYRAREKHLKYFLDHTVPLLQKHIPNGKVVIIEQDWNNKLFNRGCLLNIGVKEYENKTDHIITHDVDINPSEKSIKELYLPEVNNDTIKGLYNLSENIDTLGGIIKMKISTFFKINGFPNDIWGWGAEDFALKFRAQFLKIKIQKTYREPDNFKISNKKMYNNEYYTVFDDVNDRNQINNNTNIVKYDLTRYNNTKSIISNIGKSGLNTLQYKINQKTIINDYVELINVSI